jgi:hemoglobin
MSQEQQQTTIFELAGGQDVFFRLALRFYAGVETDEVIRPMYPPDLKQSAWWLALFLIQYCGGPGDYSGKRGHPRLRMRHLPFVIGTRERDAWLKHMNAAVEAEIENPQVKAFLTEYFERTANFMMNSTGGDSERAG